MAQDGGPFSGLGAAAGALFGGFNSFVSTLGGQFLLQIWGADTLQKQYDSWIEGEIEPFVAEIEKLATTVSEGGEGFRESAEELKNLTNDLLGPDSPDLATLETTLGALVETNNQLPDKIFNLNQDAIDELRQSSDANVEDRFDLFRTQTANVKKLGAQEHEDITQRFDDSEALAQFNLNAKGIGGSTVSQSQAALFAESKGDALARLEDQLIKQQIGVAEIFGGAALTAQEQQTTDIFNATTGQIDQFEIGKTGAAAFESAAAVSIFDASTKSNAALVEGLAGLDAGIFESIITQAKAQAGFLEQQIIPAPPGVNPTVIG